MGPTSLPVIVGALLFALAAPVVTVLTWDRPRLRLVRRIGLLLVCQLLTLVAGTALINRAGDFYTSWGELFNSGSPTKVVTDPNVANLVGLPRHLLRDTQQRIVQQVNPGQPAVPPDRTSVKAGRLDDMLPHVRHATRSRYGSMVVSVRIDGPRTGYDLPAKIYVPAAYLQHSFAHSQFPVIELLAGFPGSTQSWTDMLRLQKTMDTEIAAGRMAPTVAVLPTQNPEPLRDSECTDAVRGPQAGTYLGEDVPTVLEHQLRVRTDWAGWAVMGYSTGGWCAVNLVLRHPARFAAAISLSGYFHPLQDSTTGDLYRHDRQARNANDPRVLVRRPGVAPSWMYLAGSGGDSAAVKEIHEFVPLLPPQVHTTVAMLPAGGHNQMTWRVLERTAFRWLKDTVGQSCQPTPTSGPSTAPPSGGTAGSSLG